MRSLTEMSGSTLRSTHGFAVEEDPDRAAKALGVSRLQLLLYHQGTPNEPGCAALLRLFTEFDIAKTLGHRFVFQSDRIFRRFVVATGRVDQPLLPPSHAFLPDPAYWARRFLVDSHASYLGQIARCLKNHSHSYVQWDKLHQGARKRARGNAEFYAGDWTERMDSYLEHRGLRLGQKRTYYDWVSGAEQACLPGNWYLRYLRFTPGPGTTPGVDVYDQASPTGLRHYQETWTRAGELDSLARTYWIELAGEGQMTTADLKRIWKSLGRELLPGVGISTRLSTDGKRAYFVGPYAAENEAGQESEKLTGLIGTSEPRIDIQQAPELILGVPASKRHWTTLS